MAIALADVVENGLLDDDILQCIPHYCPSCGAEIEFSDSLRQISCPSRFCTDKIAARLEAMAKAMKVDGWGEATCRAVCEHFKLKSPYQVFLLGSKLWYGVATFNEKVNNFITSPKREAELWEVVKYGGIPSIETTAYKIFGGYSDMESAYADIEKYQVPFVADKLGLRNNDGGVMAVRVYNTLMEYKDELLFAVTQFTVASKGGTPVNVAITGGVVGYVNKAEYIDKLNRQFAGKLNIMLMSSVTANVSFLVADHDTSSNKYMKALKLREKGNPIVITNSVELPGLLCELIS